MIALSQPTLFFEVYKLKRKASELLCDLTGCFRYHYELVSQPRFVKTKLFLIVLIFSCGQLSGCVSPEDEEQENVIWIQWTDSGDCDFHVNFVVAEGRMYNEFVDYSDRVTWTDANVTGPYEFTITNLENYEKCHTLQTLHVRGEEVREDVWIQPKDESVIAIN